MNHHRMSQEHLLYSISYTENVTQVRICQRALSPTVNHSIAKPFTDPKSWAVISMFLDLVKRETHILVLH
jgi:hypothetical protein